MKGCRDMKGQAKLQMGRVFEHILYQAVHDGKGEHSIQVQVLYKCYKHFYLIKHLFELNMLTS